MRHPCGGRENNSLSGLPRSTTVLVGAVCTFINTKLHLHVCWLQLSFKAAFPVDPAPSSPGHRLLHERAPDPQSPPYPAPMQTDSLLPGRNAASLAPLLSPQPRLVVWGTANRNQNEAGFIQRYYAMGFCSGGQRWGSGPNMAQTRVDI